MRSLDQGYLNMADLTRLGGGVFIRLHVCARTRNEYMRMCVCMDVWVCAVKPSPGLAAQLPTSQGQAAPA